MSKLKKTREDSETRPGRTKKNPQPGKREDVSVRLRRCWVYKRVPEAVRACLDATILTVVNALFGCFPDKYRQKLMAGREIILVSRVLQVLCGDENNRLSVAELAKLASMISSYGGRSTTAEKPARRASQKSTGHNDQEKEAGAVSPDSARLAETVRTLIGLS